MASGSKSCQDLVLKRNEMRAILWYNFKRGLDVDACFNELKSTIGDVAPSKTTVYLWFRKFRCGHFDLEDEPREGRPKTVTDDKNVSLVAAKIEEDPSITYAQLEETLGIDAHSLHQIIHEHLGLSKKIARWVPHDLTPDQKQDRVDFAKDFLKIFNDGKSSKFAKLVTGDETWIHFYDPLSRNQSREWSAYGAAPATKSKRQRSAGKVMVAVFFTRSEILPIIELEEGCTVTAHWFATICLPKVLDEITIRNPKSGLRRWSIHFDNAPAHTANQTTALLDATGINLVQPAPYSPDLAPCDFFLFPQIKKNLRGIRFSTRAEVLTAVQNELEKIEKRDLEVCFDAWISRLQKCIEIGGNYVEV